MLRQTQIRDAMIFAMKIASNPLTPPNIRKKAERLVRLAKVGLKRKARLKELRPEGQPDEAPPRK